MATDVQDPSLQNPDDLSATEFKRRKRNTANQQLLGIADTAASGVTDLQASQAKQQEAMRAQAARNLSASWGAQGGAPVGSGGALADAQQSAMDLSTAQNAQSSDNARALAAAKMAAAQTAYDATAASAEAGNVGTDLAADLAAANSRLDTIYKDNAGWNDDEDEMNRQMQAEADKAWAAGNRKLAEWWESKIGTGDASGGQLPWSLATPEQRANAR